MKKIMFAAAAVALAGVATAANVYDYKASVKYVDFKTVTIQKAKWNVKVVKSTTLQGYLVTPIACPCTVSAGVPGVDPAFLIVQNKKSSGAEKYTGVKNPKVLPANLLVKVWRQNTSKTLQAQGYLFAGEMDQGLAVNNTVAIPSAAYDFGDNTTKESQYLYSIWNDEDPGSAAFVETWLTHAGFGKATTDVTKDQGCKKGGSNVCLVSLTGNVVGGAFTCTPNEFDIYSSWGEEFLCQGWNETAGDQTYLMDVVTGSWTIKANKKIAGITLTAGEIALGIPQNMAATDAIEELELLKACGKKLDKEYTLELVDPAFVAKWF